MTRKITIKNEGLTPYEPVDPLTLNREGKRARPRNTIRALHQWPMCGTNDGAGAGLGVRTTTTERAK